MSRKTVSQDAPEISLIVEDLDEQVAWVVGQWGAMTQWRCALCPFDTLDGEQAMIEHYVTTHVQPAAAAESPLMLADRFGNPVKPVK